MTQIANADRPSDLSSGSRRILLWCGIAIILFGILPAIMPIPDARTATATMGLLVLGAGAAEAVAALASRSGRGVRANVDILLGGISLAAGIALLAANGSSAALLVTIIAIWLLARGGADLVASAFMPTTELIEGRLIRASVDLVLGIICWIGAETIAWWEFSFGWPQSSVTTIILFAGLSLVGSGTFLIGLSRAAKESSDEQGPAFRGMNDAAPGAD